MVNNSGYDRVDAIRERIHEQQIRHTYYLLTASGACIAFAVTQNVDGALYFHDAFWMIAVALWGISIALGVSSNRQSDVFSGLDADYVFWGEERISGNPEAAAQEKKFEYERDRVADKIETRSAWQLRFFYAGGVVFVTWVITQKLMLTIAG